MMTHDEMITVITGHKAGCKIQFRPDCRPVVDWNDCVLHPVWNFSMYEYRIKPKDFPVDVINPVCEVGDVGRVFDPSGVSTTQDSLHELTLGRTVSVTREGRTLNSLLKLLKLCGPPFSCSNRLRSQRATFGNSDDPETGVPRGTLGSSNAAPRKQAVRYLTAIEVCATGLKATCLDPKEQWRTRSGKLLLSPKEQCHLT